MVCQQVSHKLKLTQTATKKNKCMHKILKQILLLLRVLLQLLLLLSGGL